MALKTFNSQYYLEQNPDVADAVARGVFTSAEQHYLMYGEKEGRWPSEAFDPTVYLAQNPDVAAAVAFGMFASALEHFERYGLAEGRSPGIAYDEAFYLSQNPDVLAAVASGMFTSGYQHFALYGAAEGRAPVDPGPSEGAIFTLRTPELAQPETPPDPVLMWGYTPEDERVEGASQGIPAEDLYAFLDEIAGIDFLELGLIDDDGVDPAEFISNITIGDISASDSAFVNVTLTDGQVLSAEAELGEAYLEFLSDLLFDANGDSRLYLDYPDDPAYAPTSIVLTPTQNNGGTYEGGFTTGNNETIVAGRPELLHEAYIDAGGGYDILEVDMKGVYAQPLQLLNIEEIRVQNLPNVYAADDPRDPDGDPLNSVLDLSRATSIERLVVTEGWDNGAPAGDLSIVGIRNGATARLEGGFTENLYLHYGEGLGSSVTVELSLGDTDGFHLNVAQNTNTLNLVSEGNENWIEDAYLGGQLRTLNISGDAALYIEGDLNSSFHMGRPATIDARENTGGVDLKLNNHGDDASDPVEFYGTDAGDSFTAMYNESVMIVGGDGDNLFVVDGSDTVEIESGAGDDMISAIGDHGAETVVIDAGGGDNEVVAGANEVEIATGAGDDEVQVFGAELTVDTGGGDDLLILSGNPGTAEALVELDLGSADTSDMLQLGDDAGSLPHSNSGLIALDGSSIEGEDIHLKVVYSSDLSRAELDGITRVTLAGEDMNAREEYRDDNTVGELTLTAEQFAAIGAAAFAVDRASFGETQDLVIVIDEDVTLSDLIDVAALSENVRLNFIISNGATLTLSAEELHEHVAARGIDSNDGLNGKVVITDAGLTFDAFNNGDESDLKVIPGGTLSPGWSASDDVTIIRTVGGFERPTPADPSDTLTVDSDVTPVVDEPIDTGAKTLKIVGSADITFNEPVDLAPLTDENGVKIGDGADAFVVDFSSPGFTGTLLALTLANFQDVAEIKGNGADGTRIDVQIAEDADVAADPPVGVDKGLKSSGVQTYVVTELNGGTSEFYVCDQTKDLQTLGLQGNHDGTIAFLQVKWGVDFLLEGDGSVDFPAKAAGNPNWSNIGTLNAQYFWEGAEATVNVDNQGTALTDRSLHVEGINIGNAESITVNVEDGDAIIASINNDQGFLGGNDRVETLTFVSAGDVTLQGNLDIGDDGDGLATLDASGVAGTFTFELTDAVASDLSDVAVTGLDAVVFADADAELTLSADQVLAVGAESFSTADDDFGTLNVADLGTQELDLGAIDVGNIGTVTIVDADGVVTLAAGTDLGGADKVVIQAETSDTTLELTAAQFNQIAHTPAEGPIVEAELDNDPVTGEAYEATVVITDLAPDQDLDLNNLVDVAPVIRIAGLVAEGDDPDTAEIEGMTVTANPANLATLEVAGGDNDLSAPGLLVGAAIGKVVFTADATLTLTAEQVQLIGVENFSAAEGVTVTLNIVDVADGFDLDLNVIQDAGINIGTLTLMDGTDAVTLDPSATLGGADAIVTPTADVDDAGDDDGLEDTVFTLTAAQFNQTAGVITGDALVNITNLANNTDSDGDVVVDVATIDLSGVTAPRGTVDLGPDPATVTLAEDADLADFVIVLADGQMIRFSTEVQASAEIQAPDGNTAVAWLFDTVTGPIDTAAYDAGIDTLYVNEDLVDGQNVEELWTFLSGTITVEVVNSNDIPDVLVQFDRTLVVDALTAVDGLTFDPLEEFQTIRNLTIELQGNTSIGDLVIDDTVGEGTFETLTIRSVEDRSSLGEDNGFAFLPNKVGDIGLSATPSNELVDIVLDTGSEATPDDPSDTTGLALEVGTIVFGSDTGDRAMLTLTGANDISIEGLDISDAELTLLTVDASGMSLDGTGSPTLTIGGVDQEDLLAALDTITLIEGHVSPSGVGVTLDEIGSAAGNDLLQVVGGENDLSAATVLDVEAVHFTGPATLTLTAAQIVAIGIADADGDGVADNWSVAEGVTGVVLNIVDLSDQALDLNLIAAAGIDIGTISIANTDGEVHLDPTTTLGGADSIVMPTADGIDAGEEVEQTSLFLTAEQFHQLEGAGTITGEGTVNITDLMNTVDSDDDGDLDQTTIDLSGVTAPNGTITLGEADVEVTAATNLAGFSITLDDIDSDPLIGNEVAGQTIRFATAVQAEREIIVTGWDGDAAPGTTGEEDTNVVWLFDTVEGTASPGKVDTSGYDAGLGRLWVNDQLVDGENVEELFTTIGSDTVIRVVNTADLDELLPESEGIDRRVEIEAFASLPGGLVFNDEDLLEHVRSLTLDLGGDVTIGDLSLDNLLAAEVANDDIFESLTINSLLADNPDHYLLPEDWDPETNPLPTGPNTVGDIQSGPNRTQLTDVTLNAAGVELVIGTIFFAEEDDAGAMLSLDGSEDITVAVLDTSDAEIVGLTVDAGGYTGTFTVTGLSPAAAVDNTETLEFTGGAGATLVFGTGGNAGVAGEELSSIDASEFDGTLNLGTLAEIDSEDFSFESGSGRTTLALGSADGYDGDAAPELADEGAWSFDLSDAAADSVLTLTDAVTLGAGSLELTMGPNAVLAIVGNVDFSTLAADDPATPETEGLDFIGNATIELVDGATLRMTDEQWAAFGGQLTFVPDEDGEVIVEVTAELIAAIGNDLTLVRGATEIRIDNGLEVTLTPEQADIARVRDADGELGDPGVLGDAVVTIYVQSDEDLTRFGDGLAGIVIEDTDEDPDTVDHTVTLTVAQASGLVGAIDKNGNEVSALAGDTGDAEPMDLMDPAGDGSVPAYDLSEVDILVLEDPDGTVASSAQISAVGTVDKQGNPLFVEAEGDATGVDPGLVDELRIGFGVSVTLTPEQAAIARVRNEDGDLGVPGDLGDADVTILVQDDADLTGLTGISAIVIEDTDGDPATADHTVELTLDQANDLVGSIEKNGNLVTVSAGDSGDGSPVDLTDPAGDGSVAAYDLSEVDILVLEDADGTRIDLAQFAAVATIDKGEDDNPLILLAGDTGDDDPVDLAGAGYDLSEVDTLVLEDEDGTVIDAVQLAAVGAIDKAGNPLILDASGDLTELDLGDVDQLRLGFGVEATLTPEQAAVARVVDADGNLGDPGVLGDANVTVLVRSDADLTGLSGIAAVVVEDTDGDPATADWTVTLTVAQASELTLAGAIEKNGNEVTALAGVSGNDDPVDLAGAGYDLSEVDTLVLEDGDGTVIDQVQLAAVGTIDKDGNPLILDASGDLTDLDLGDVDQLRIGFGADAILTPEQAAVARVEDADGNLGAAGALGDANVTVLVRSDADLTGLSGIAAVVVEDTDGDPATADWTVTLTATQASELAGGAIEKNGNLLRALAGDTGDADPVDLTDPAYDLSEVDILVLEDADGTVIDTALLNALGTIDKDGNPLILDASGDLTDLDLGDVDQLRIGFGADAILTPEQAAVARVEDADGNLGDPGALGDANVTVLVRSDADLTGLSGIAAVVVEDTDGDPATADWTVTLTATQASELAGGAIEKNGNLLRALAGDTGDADPVDLAGAGYDLSEVDILVLEDADGTVLDLALLNAFGTIEKDGNPLILQASGDLTGVDLTAVDSLIVTGDATVTAEQAEAIGVAGGTIEQDDPGAAYTLTVSGLEALGTLVNDNGPGVADDYSLSVNLTHITVDGLVAELDTLDEDGDAANWQIVTASQLANARVVLAGGGVVSLNVSDATGRSMTGVGTVNVTGLNSAGPYDLSQIAIAGVVTLSGNALLNAGTDLGDFAVDIGGNTLGLTADQADGRSITGTGNVTVTGLDDAAIDLSGIDVGGTLVIQVDGLTELTLTADRADGTVLQDAGGVLVTVNVTDFEDTPAADLSQLNTGDPWAVNVALDSSGGVEIGATANLGSAIVTISGNGTVTVADGAVVAGADFVVGDGARLVADQGLLVADSVIDPTNVSGAGTLELTGLDDPVTVTEAVRTTEIDFDGAVLPIDMNGFTEGTFEFGGVAGAGVHILDFTARLGNGLLFDIVDAPFASANQTGNLNDILAFSIGEADDAAAVRAAFQNNGLFDGDGGSATPIGFAPNSEKVFAITDTGGDTNLWFWDDTGNGVVGTAELTLLGTLVGVSQLDGTTVTADNFVL